MRTPHPARLSPLGVLSCKHPDPDPERRSSLLKLFYEWNVCITDIRNF